MPTTSNFGWTTPADTDLVKDGALAIRTLGNGIDTSLVDLKGGTTGQVLSKTSNTDMDFTWVTTDDADAIQNAIVDAKGDLIAASAADTPARLAVGNNGETLVADSSATTGLRWQGNFAAGKNKIINGDCFINQRGTTSTTTSSTYLVDRMRFATVDGTVTGSVQQFTAGTAPVSGYEAKQFIRIQTTGQTLVSAQSGFDHRIENVRTFAGQTITVSFWAKAASGTPQVALAYYQNFGNGGSPSSQVIANAGNVTLSTSWTRYSITVAIPSISGKTIGTSEDSYLRLHFYVSAGSDLNTYTQSMGIQTNTFDFWGIQAEAGNVATAFQTATGTLAGELAACQRYYWRISSGDTGQTTNYLTFASGYGKTTTTGAFTMFPPVTLRTGPTTVDYSQLIMGDGAGGTFTPSAIAVDTSARTVLTLSVTTTGLTQYRPYALFVNGSTTAYLAFSAEL